MPHSLDQIDRHLLDLLQAHGRMSHHDLAQHVGLSAPAVGDRLRKLEEREVIRHFSVVVDPKRVGLDVTAFIAIGIAGSQFFEPFIARAEAADEVLECHAVTGNGSHLLKIRTASTSSLETLLAEIQSWPGVQWTTTSIVLSTQKETARIALAGPTEPPAPAADD